MKNGLSKYYNVSDVFIENRLESLRYEIDQYLNGCDLNDIEILSNRKQLERGIKAQSLNTKATCYLIEDYGNDIY